MARNKIFVEIWDDALLAMRHVFGISKPVHKIFLEFFTEQQADDMSTDVFVTNRRPILSRLSKNKVLDHTHKLDMI